MSRALVLAAVVSAIAPAARADVWQRALEPKASDGLADAVYEREMRDGDDHVALANDRGISFRLMRERIQYALTAYRNAATAKPTRAEPWLRIGDTIYSFYLDSCSHQLHGGISPSPLRDCTRPDGIDIRMAEQAIAAWDAAEARAPLHPRFTSDVGESLLFTRAIVHTRIATKPHLQKAAADYQRLLERVDDVVDLQLERIWGNLAETHMMLGDLEQAITAYREAWKVGHSTSTAYGLAVAFDRDGSDLNARAWVERPGRGGFADFKEGVAAQRTFFVPYGEVFYYYALIEEIWGNDRAAIDYWRQYLASGAHPQFQPRARAHLDALIAKRRAAGRPIPPPDPFMDMR